MANASTDFDAIFRDITCGNADAFNFCYAFFQWVHCLDDLVDRDKDVPPTSVSMLLYSFIHTIASNPFFQSNKSSLLPTFLLSLQAWADSEDWKRSPDVLHRIASQVLKSQYQDVFLHVAALCGGQPHMQEMARKYRDYNFDEN